MNLFRRSAVLYSKIELLSSPSSRGLKTILLLLFTLLVTFNFYMFVNQRETTVQNIQKYIVVLDQPLWKQDIDFDKFDIANDTGTPNGCYVVPNYVHFIRFGNYNFTYMELMCVLAALKNQRPTKIYFHRDHNESFHGKYWSVLSSLKAFTDIVEYTYEELPTEIFGQKLGVYRTFHGSDLIRIRILMKYGGIFLDNDSYVVKSLDIFRRFEMSLSWDEGSYLGTQILVAHKNARFLKLWLESYRDNYKPNDWYYNAGERPTREILWKRPELIHRVKEQFGTRMKDIYVPFKQNNNEWKNFYTIHLLQRHQHYMLENLSPKATFPVVLNESNIAYYPMNFRTMAYDVYDFANLTWPKDIKS